MSKLSVGEKAPDFTLPVVGGGEVNLSQELARAEKGVIVYFYPRAMTPGCTKEACDFRDSNTLLQAGGYRIIGISPDGIRALEKFTASQHLNFPLAADESKAVMEEWGAFGEKKNYGKIVRGVIRSTFVISKDKTIALAKYNVRATGHVGRLLKELNLEN